MSEGVIRDIEDQVGAPVAAERKPGATVFGETAPKRLRMTP